MEQDEPVDLTGPNWNEVLGLPEDASLPPPGMTFDQVEAQIAALLPWDCALHLGDRLELTVDALVGFMWAEFMTDGAHCVVPAGTQFEIDMEPVESAIGFPCRPVDPDAVARLVAPRSLRKREKMVNARFHAVFLKAHVGQYLRLLD